MPKHSQVHLAAFLAVVMTCWSQSLSVVPYTVKEISDFNGSKLAAPVTAVAWGRDSRPADVEGGSVCSHQSAISAAQLLNAIRRLLATEDKPRAITSTNRSSKKPTEKSRKKLSRLSFQPNDVTEVRQQLRQYDALTSFDGVPMTGVKQESAEDRMGNEMAEAFQVVGSFTDRDLKMLLREAASRRMGNRATAVGRGDDSNVRKATQRQPSNTPSLGYNSRQLNTPPLKNIALIMNDGRRAAHSKPIVFAPGMDVNNVLTQAAILFDIDATSDVNPFECDVTRSRSHLCYVIKECAGKIVDQWNHWNIEVKDTFGEVVSRGVCMPSRPLMPGYSVGISYVNTQSV